MRSRRLFLVAVSLTALVGCGVSPQVRSETKETQPTMQVLTPNAWAAGDAAVERALAAAAFVVAVEANHVQEQPPDLTVDPEPSVTPPVTEVASTTSYDWYAIARCETGQNWNMTGSLYSTGLGMMNQAIRENSPPDVAERELTGTASVAEIIGTAESIEAKHGIHSWGCGKALYP